MGILGSAKGYARFAFGLRGFLRQTISVDEAWSAIARRMADRADNLLRVVRRGVFEHGDNPYRRLFDHAGCGFGDFERLVRDDGVEAALRKLYDAGVYVTFDEFKGRIPVRRGSLEFQAQARDFDNPYLRHAYYGSTSGSTGAGTRISFDLDHIVEDCRTKVAVRNAHGVGDAPIALWRAALPSVAGLNNVLCSSLAGEVAERWFSPIGPGDLRIHAKDRIATRYVLTAARWLGTPLPTPEPVPLSDPGPVLDWAVATVKDRGRCIVSTFVSPAVRVCVAAHDRGIDLSGVTFMGGGEPATEAKLAAVRRVGAKLMPGYGMSESGTLAVPCARPAVAGDFHVARDMAAIIQVPHELPDWNETVGAFCITTLMPTAPKLMFNVATDDFGVIEKRDCGCPFHGCGYTDHIHGIRSYRKLTGEGVTLIGNDAVRILEEVLPARFGGGPLDYQLLEEEDESGMTRLSLLIHPGIEIGDETAVVAALVDGLRGSGDAAAYAAAFWSRGDAIRVRRAEPVWGAGGKLMPLCVAERVRRARGGGSP